MVRLDALVFPPAAEGHLGLRLPCPAVADNRLAVENLSDADRDAVRPVCLDMADAILEARLDHRGRMAADAGKLADHEPHPADAGLVHPDLAWTVCPVLPAWVDLVER